jgi:hypothetical protein
MLINGCNKDGEITDHELSYRNSSNTGTSAILSKINFDQDGNILLGSGTSQVTLQHASIEFQREVSDYIFDNLSFSRIDSMKEMFGHPVWELAIIDMSNTNDNNYFITIPLIKSNKYTSYIYFQKFNDKVSAHLISENKIQSILEQTSGESHFFNKWLYIVSRFEIYNFLINDYMDDNYHSWMDKVLSSTIRIADSLNYRDAEEGDRICYLCATGWYCPECHCEDNYHNNYQGSGGSNNGNSGGNVTIPDFNGYFGDDGFGNDWTDGDDFGKGSSGGGGTGNYGDSGDNVPKVDKAKKLKCAREVADFMAQAEVLQLIKNNNLTDPCDPTKSAAELLEKALNGYCYAKIGDEPLNLQDAEHFMGEIMEGGDHIITDSKLAEKCPTLSCIWNQMKDGVLGTEFVCKQLSNFDGPNSPGTLLKVSGYDFVELSKTNHMDPTASAATITLPNGSIIIAINTTNCGGDKLNIFETLQHELVHAQIFSRLFKYYGYNGSVESLNYHEAFHQLVLKEYGGQAGPEQHNLMLEYFLKDMVNSLIEITGKGTYEDYEGLVLNGFPPEVLIYCGITNQELKEKVDRYKDFKIKNPGIFYLFDKFCP